LSKRSIYFKFRDLNYTDGIFQKYVIGGDSIQEIDSCYHPLIEEVIPRAAWRRGVYKIRKHIFLSRGTSYLTYFQGKWYSCWEYGDYEWIHPAYPPAAEMEAMRLLGHSKLSKEASYCLSYWNRYKQMRNDILGVRRIMRFIKGEKRVRFN
jgi:hypothetical protein